MKSLELNLNPNCENTIKVQPVRNNVLGKTLTHLHLKVVKESGSPCLKCISQTRSDFRTEHPAHT